MRAAARVVHWKGKLKPWHHSCGEALLIGAPSLSDAPAAGAGRGVGAASTLSTRDVLRWDGAAKRCVLLPEGKRSSRALLSTLPAVRWSTPGFGAVGKSCCVDETLLQAEWYRLLDQFHASMPGGVCAKTRDARYNHECVVALRRRRRAEAQLRKRAGGAG